MERGPESVRLTAVLRLTLATLLLVTGCGAAGTDRDDLRATEPAAAPVWERLPDPPLTPRSSAAVHWTGKEVLVLGGDTAPLCPPTAGCADPPQPQTDGAAYDPVAGRWRKTRPAPSPFLGPGVRDGQSVWFVTEKQSLASYDAAADRWTEHPPPPGPFGASFVLAVSRGLPVALRSEQRAQRLPDALYDPQAGAWAELPPDPLAPSFDRAAVDTAQGLLVTGAEAVDNPGSERPALLRASLLDVETRTWTRLPDSDQLVGSGIALHGDRAVWPDLGGADGGEVNNYGRTIAFGGVLDLAARTWRPLAGAPAEGSGDWPAFALGGPVSASEGYLYDDRSARWTRLSRPADGPAAPGPAVWAGDHLVVVGGTTEPGDRYDRVRGAWLLRGAGR